MFPCAKRAREEDEAPGVPVKKSRCEGGAGTAFAPPADASMDGVDMMEDMVEDSMLEGDEPVSWPAFTMQHQISTTSLSSFGQTSEGPGTPADETFTWDASSNAKGPAFFAAHHQQQQAPAPEPQLSISGSIINNPLTLYPQSERLEGEMMGEYLKNTGYGHVNQGQEQSGFISITHGEASFGKESPRQLFSPAHSFPITSTADGSVRYHMA